MTVAQNIVEIEHVRHEQIPEAPRIARQHTGAVRRAGSGVWTATLKSHSRAERHRNRTIPRVATAMMRMESHQ
jgi:hypothetical protein